MKTTLKLSTLLLAITFLLGSCGSGSNENEASNQEEVSMENEHAAHEADHMKEEEAPNQEVSEASFSSLNEEQASTLLNAYLGIKDALVSSSHEGAKESAKQITEVIKEEEESSVLRGILEDATQILESKEIENIRVEFESLSVSVYQMVKAKDAGKTVYKQYCPMAFDNKGAFWISADEEVKNPYFGDKMLNCGKVEETISSN